MLKFINESDFLLVDEYKQNQDGTVSWTYNEGTDLPTHCGIIRKDLKRISRVQDGTELVIVGQRKVLDSEGNPTYDDMGGEITEDIMEESPKIIDVELNIWAKLWELHDDENSPINVLPVDIQEVRKKAKEVINTQRDTLINSGVNFNGNVFQTDTISMMNIMGAIVAEIDTTWITADNQYVYMSISDMKTLGQSIADHKKRIALKARDHKDNIDLLNTEPDIDNYIATLSWD